MKELITFIVASTLAPALLAGEEAMPLPSRTIAKPAYSIPEWRSIGNVVKIDVTMSADDWQALRNQSRDISIKRNSPDWSCTPFDSPFTWFVADEVSINSKAYEQVRIRKKGFRGSVSSYKPALKLRLDKYIDQDYQGTTRLTLNNSIQDMSMLNTCLVYKIFRDAGLPAPLCNYADVTINGERLGMYVNVEDMKTDFFERNFNGEGNLYEGTMSDFLPELTGTFEKKTENPGLDYIQRVTEAIQRNDTEAIHLIDVDKFLTFWALESLLNLYEGYTQAINNYYFYETVDGLVFIPWGADRAFLTRRSSFVFLRGALARALFPPLQDKYKQRMKHLLDTVWDERALLSYVNGMVNVVGENDGTLRVRSFILTRREQIRNRLHKDYTTHHHKTTPYKGDCKE